MNGSELEGGLSQVLETVAIRLGAQQAALIRLGIDGGIVCEIDFTQPGSGCVREFIGQLTDEARQSIARDLTESQSDIRLEYAIPTVAAGGHHLGVATLLRCAIHPEDAPMALLLRGVRAPEPIDEELTQYLRALSQLMCATLKRLNSYRIDAEAFRASSKMARAGRAILSLAHDFNNSLYSISCVTDVMLLSASEPSPARTNLDNIKQAVRRATSLTRRLVAFGKETATTLETLELGELVTSFAPILRSILGPRVNLKIELGNIPVRTLTSRSVVEHLLLEVVLGACPSSTQPHEFVIRVADDRGIARGSLEDHSGSRPAKCWLTIGANNSDGFWKLSESRELQSLMEALKEIGAVALCQDAQIEVEFVSSGVSISTPGEPPRIQREKSASGTVLCVEDDDALRRATTHILSRAGYRVLEADSYRSATEILSAAEQPIVALVTDVLLPDGDGVLLYKQLLELRATSKAIFISGYGPDILEERGVVGNAHGFLQKPCRAAELPRLLQRLLADARPVDSTYLSERT